MKQYRAIPENYYIAFSFRESMRGSIHFTVHKSRQAAEKSAYRSHAPWNGQTSETDWYEYVMLFKDLWKWCAESNYKIVFRDLVPISSKKEWEFYYGGTSMDLKKFPSLKRIK